MPYLVVLSGYLGLLLAAATMIHGYVWGNRAISIHFMAGVITCILICYFEVGWLFMILAVRSGLKKRKSLSAMQQQAIGWLQANLTRWTIEIIAALILFTAILLSGGATHTGVVTGWLHGAGAVLGFAILVWLVYRQQNSIFAMQERINSR